MQNVATQLDSSALQAIIEGLTQTLSETAVETMKAQNYHWNVVGMSFGSLHEMFQEIYEDHFQAQDDLAERIKALDGHAEGRLSVHIERSKIEECDGRIDDKTMIANLLADQQTIAGTLSELAALAAQQGDALTEDLAIERGRVHEKFAWMLRAHLKG
ncbi:MAG: DNA starvation/stationary phase protection protein [Pseudomonadota bacterium]